MTNDHTKTEPELPDRPLHGSALTKRTSLSLPPSLPLDEWRTIGRQIYAISESSAWWLGDWLIYGQSQYPDRYKRAITETSLDYQTLRNYAWVARQYPTARRRMGLSFQHHAELAGMTEPEQDEWLDRAARFGWSRNELRNRVRASRKANGASADGQLVKIQMDLPQNRRERWLQAASTSEQDLLSWMVSVLDAAAGTAIETDQDQLELQLRAARG